MILSLIVAASENNVIGKDGEIPWKLPNDLKYFRKVTEGHPVIMGRKTYQSIGRPLPNRENIVLTRQENLEYEGVDVVSSIDEALAKCTEEEEVFIIGGGDLYKAILDQADRVYLTRVHTVVEGDAFFPELDKEDWEEVSKEPHDIEEGHDCAYTFLTYKRR